MSRRLLPKALLDLLQRAKLAYQVLVAPRHVVATSIGQLVSYDPVNRRLVIDGDFEIHATGNLYLNSDQHVVVHSGNRAGTYTHKIWLNPDLEDEYAIHVEGEQGSSSERDLQSITGQEGFGTPADHGEDHCCPKGQASSSSPN